MSKLIDLTDKETLRISANAVCAEADKIHSMYWRLHKQLAETSFDNTYEQTQCAQQLGRVADASAALMKARGLMQEELLS